MSAAPPVGDRGKQVQDKKRNHNQSGGLHLTKGLKPQETQQTLCPFTSPLLGEAGEGQQAEEQQQRQQEEDEASLEARQLLPFLPEGERDHEERHGDDFTFAS